MIRHCDREARSGKQSAALLESKTVQITHKRSKLHPVIFALWPNFWLLSTITTKEMIRHCDPPAGGEAIF
jgi:hypothetical protein